MHGPESLAAQHGRTQHGAEENAQDGRPDADQPTDLDEDDDLGDRDQEQRQRSEEHTSELQSLMRISYAVFCLKKKNKSQPQKQRTQHHKTVYSKNNKQGKP